LSLFRGLVVAQRLSRLCLPFHGSNSQIFVTPKQDRKIGADISVGSNFPDLVLPALWLGREGAAPGGGLFAGARPAIRHAKKKKGRPSVTTATFQPALRQPAAHRGAAKGEF
jgi:hypothetical protein